MDENRRKLLFWSRKLTKMLKLAAPNVVVRAQWERVLEHGSNLFGEVIYSVSDVPTRDDEGGGCDADSGDDSEDGVSRE